jgi:WD40 repeat protein
VYDVIKRKLVNHIVTPESGVVTSVAALPNGDLVAATDDTHINLYDAHSWKLVRQIQDAAGPMAFSPDGSRVAAVICSHEEHAQTKDVGIWDVATGTLRRTFTGHWGDATSISFSPDGTRLLVGSDDACAKVWDVATQKELGQLNHLDSVRAVAWAASADWIVTAGDDDRLKLWDGTSFVKRADIHADLNGGGLIK